MVCGAKEHIDTLHFSLDRLKRVTAFEIIVLTDTSRNEEALQHTNIVDVKTPTDFNNHQASIYLKTGLHKFLPKKKRYCYLDTDVIALNPTADLIFDAYVPPITFAPDHCKMKKFSAYAVNCGCQEEWDEKRTAFQNVKKKYDNNKPLSPQLEQQRLKLEQHFVELKSSFFKRLFTAFNYFTSLKRFDLNEDFYFDKKKRIWFDIKSGNELIHEVDVKKIEKETNLKYNRWNQKWLDQEGNDIWQDECNHLKEYISTDLKIPIQDANWQHWNGGVFLFDDESHAFLNEWHERTLKIFTLDNWKTRDQGTLIATVWNNQLQNQKTLSKQWNFIADYYKPGVAYKNDGSFTDDNWQTSYKASFVHIYHHWADETWDVWNWVVKSTNLDPNKKH